MVFSADGGDVVFRGGGVVEKEEIEWMEDEDSVRDIK